MRNRPSGFTLIELSIVLVIIALLIGGMLMGKDLIKAAQIKSQISDLSRFATATNAFRNKYNGLPGDLLNADRFGFTYNTSVLTNRGDGVINNFLSVAAPVDYTFPESYHFFVQLFEARLISEPYAHQSTVYGFRGLNGYSAQFAKTKVGEGGIYALTTSGKLAFGLMLNLESLGTNLGLVSQLSTGGTLSAIDAFSLDTKLDDGVPSTGRVKAVTNYLGAFDVAVNGCVVDGSALLYNTTLSGLNCRLFSLAQ